MDSFDESWEPEAMKFPHIIIQLNFLIFDKLFCCYHCDLQG